MPLQLASYQRIIKRYSIVSGVIIQKRLGCEYFSHHYVYHSYLDIPICGSYWEVRFIQASTTRSTVITGNTRCDCDRASRSSCIFYSFYFELNSSSLVSTLTEEHPHTLLKVSSALLSHYHTLHTTAFHYYSFCLISPFFSLIFIFSCSSWSLKMLLSLNHA